MRHHLADPSQEREPFSSWRSHDPACRKAWCFALTRALAFASTVTASWLIRTSHPSGSRCWGFPLRGRHPTPGSLEPQKILSTLPWPSGQRSLSREATRARWTLCVQRARVAPRAVRLHRSLASPWGEVQPVAGCMTEAHQSKSFAPRQRCGDAAAANQLWWLLANPITGSPQQPRP